MPADPLDVTESGTRPRQQRERYRQVHFGHDDKAGAGGEVVQRRGDDPFHRALDRHNGPFGGAVPDRGERGLDGRAGQTFDRRVDNAQRGLGERSLGPQIGIRHRAIMPA
jgi:hypothetical protein